MRNAQPTTGRTNRQYPMGFYPWKIRPGYVGGGNVRCATATCSVSGSNLDSATVMNVTGVPVLLSGDKPPEFPTNPVRVSYIPQSASSMISQSQTSGSATWAGSSIFYLQFYQNGLPIDQFQCGTTAQSGTTRYVAFNYEYGENAMTGIGFIVPQFSGYPDSVGVNLALIKSSVSLTLKVMLLWAT